MTKFWLAGVAAFAMMTGTALAQDTSSDTTTTTHSAGMGSSSATKSRETVDSDGTQTDKSKSYTRDSSGIHARSDTQTVAPDGTVRSTSHDEQTASPGDDTVTRSRTTTTTGE
ncbi:MAG TPA: hypothetical protein VH020_01320 [Stellaceae bacterium]|jgi:hypothetical protein|nr:hypothetical protein [Stellaceae bacterium]